MDNTDFKIDLSYLKSVANGSDEFLIEMIDLFLDQNPEYFSQLNQFIIQENWNKVADLAHKIKPSLAFMGVKWAVGQMAEVEKSARNLENLDTIAAIFEELNSMSLKLYEKLKAIKVVLQGLS